MCVKLCSKEWFTVGVNSRGVQSTVETAPNEAIHSCWKQGLISPVYLLSEPYKSIAPTSWGCFQVISGKSWCSGKPYCWLTFRLAVMHHAWNRSADSIHIEASFYHTSVCVFMKRGDMLGSLHGGPFLADNKSMIFCQYQVDTSPQNCGSTVCETRCFQEFHHLSSLSAGSVLHKSVFVDLCASNRSKSTCTQNIRTLRLIFLPPHSIFVSL